MRGRTEAGRKQKRNSFGGVYMTGGVVDTSAD